MNQPVAPLLLSHADRETLTRWAQGTSAPYRVVTGAKALLMAGDGVAQLTFAQHPLGGAPVSNIPYGKLSEPL